MVQRDIFPNDNLEELATEAQQLASEKEKQAINSIIRLIFNNEALVCTK